MGHVVVGVCRLCSMYMYGMRVCPYIHAQTHTCSIYTYAEMAAYKAV